MSSDPGIHDRDHDQENTEQAPLKENINGSGNVKSLEAERDRRWLQRLKHSGGGKGPIKKTLANTLIALRQAPEWKNALKYDASALTVVLDRRPPWDKGTGAWPPRLWTDQDDRLLAEWLQQNNIDVGDKTASDAAQTVARERSFHPIRDYLDGLTWDGIPRVENWLATYLGAKPSDYHREVGRRWLISGVARIYRPAVKADCMLILEGQQGSGKSTALKALGGEWFTDEIGELGSKDAAMSIAGRWIIEFGELEEFKGASLERLKAFLSRTIDRFRPPYGRAVVDSPRQCIFAGTTNPEEYLHDSTGNRRFWPVKCFVIDIFALKRDRDQLWAEAKSLFEAGYSWWLETAELQNLAALAQEDRFLVDPWEQEVAEYLTGKTEKTIAQVLKDVFKIDVAQTTRKEQHRIGAILRRLGWERHQLDAGGIRTRVFRPKKSSNT